MVKIKFWKEIRIFFYAIVVGNVVKMGGFEEIF
jgi:hypothetical protein